MRFLAILLTLIALNASAQLYYKSEYQPPVFENGWSPPREWRDSLGYIDITDGKNLAINTVKLLVDTRIGTGAIALMVTVTGGYKVKWGKGESWINYTTSSTAVRKYDTTKCQRYCVIEIKPQGANNLSTCAYMPPTGYSPGRCLVPVLWVAANYPGSAPCAASSAADLSLLQAIWLKSITTIPAYTAYNAAALQSFTIPSSAITWSGGNAVGNASTLRGAIVIPSGGTVLGGATFENCKCVDSVVVPSGYTTIGNYVFNNMYAAKKFALPSTVTSIGTGIATNCYAATEFTYTGTITTAQDHGNNTLDNCYNILTINWPGLKTTRISMNGTSGALLKLGSGGNIPGDSIPFRIDWANSTFAHATAPQLDLSYTSLDTTQIQKIFRCLPTVGAPSSNTKTVSVAGSTGAATLSAYARAIATAKGWQVTY